MDQLVDLVTDRLGHRIPFEMRDNKSSMLGSSSRSRLGECSTQHQRRPDIMWLVRDADSRIVAVVMVEVDEDSHTSRDSQCEAGKADETFESVVQLAQQERSSDSDDFFIPQVIFIRFNPNACDAPGGAIRLQTRVCVLAARLCELLNTPPEEFRRLSEKGLTMKPYIEIFYYHTKQGQKHLDFYAAHPN